MHITEIKLYSLKSTPKVLCIRSRHSLWAKVNLYGYFLISVKQFFIVDHKITTYGVHKKKQCYLKKLDILK